MNDSIKLITLDPQALLNQWKDLRAALDQTETLMKALKVPIPGSIQEPPKVDYVPPSRGAPSNLTQAVKTACRTCGVKGSFTKYDVEDVLRAQGVEFSPASVSAIMSMAATAKEIIPLEKGTGGRPSTYKLP